LKPAQLLTANCSFFIAYPFIAYPLTFFKKQVYYLIVYFKGTGVQIPTYTRNCDWAALEMPDTSVAATGRVQYRLNAIRFAWEGLMDFAHKTGNFGIQAFVFSGPRGKGPREAVHL
jgi:hypothetical protein